MSATRGSHSTEYTGHDISAFFPRADNHFLTGFLSVTFPFDCIFLWSLPPSCQMSRHFHQTCFDVKTLYSWWQGGRMIKSQRQLTQPTWLKITLGIIVKRDKEKRESENRKGISVLLRQHWKPIKHYLSKWNKWWFSCLGGFLDSWLTRTRKRQHFPWGFWSARNWIQSGSVEQSPAKQSIASSIIHQSHSW